MKKTLSILISVMLVLALLVSPVYASGGGGGGGTGGGGGNNPLSLVSATIDGSPVDGAEVGPSGTISILFDRGMDKNKDTTMAAIHIEGADASVGFDGDRTFTVTFSGLAAGRYTLVVGANATANNGNTLGTEYRATFTVKESQQGGTPSSGSPYTGDACVPYVICAVISMGVMCLYIKIRKNEE